MAEENASSAAMPANPEVSVLVRARNDEAFIARTLDAVFAQKTDFRFEVLVCDDASEDATRAIAARYPVRFVERPQGAYMPGRTLNEMIRAARGKIVVFNNADAVPLHDRWLAEIVRPIVESSGEPVFTFARQVPRPGASALVAKDYDRAFGDGTEHAKWRFFFSLASAAAPRSMLIETPFCETIRYSEDVEWTWRNSRRAANPVRIVYAPAARVEHSHEYTLRQTATRFRGEGRADAAIFGDKPSLAGALASAVRETLRDFAWLARRPRAWHEMFRAPAYRLVQRLAHWRGLKDAQKKSPSSPGPGTAPRAAPLPPPSGKVLLYLEPAAQRGGIEIFAWRQAAALRTAGCEVEIAHSLPQTFSGYSRILVHKCTEVAVLEKFPPERTVFYVHDHEPVCPRKYAYTPFLRNCRRPGALWPCAFCAAARKDWLGGLKAAFAQKRKKRALARFVRLAVISEFMKTRLVENGFDPARIIVETPPAPRVALTPGFKPPEPVDMLFAGQIIRGKGLQLLLRAMARMETPRTLDVIGTGNMERKLRRLAARLGVAERVRWRGFRDNPQDWMAAARCVVAPSFWQEPYGLVAAEAAALEKKVFAFAIGGLPEACGAGAVLVPAGDVAALAAALDRDFRETER